MMEGSPVILDDLEVILEKSDRFHSQNPFPLETTRCKVLRRRNVASETLLKNANESYPLIHEELIPLIKDFIRLKRNNGTNIEREIYKEMTLPSFIQRLLEKRPLMFVGVKDKYILRNDRMLRGMGGFEKIGTPEEQQPLVMRDYLSYEEMKISALMATCSPTVVINKGSRMNMGRVEREHEEEAFIVGLVGTRFPKKEVMEGQDMRIIRDQVTSYYGKQREDTVASIFARFYEIPYFPVYEEVHQLFAKRVTDSPFEKEDFHIVKQARRHAKKEYFNRKAYMKRIRITAETFLMEANERARQVGKKAYVHVVGLGLGVWKHIHEQERWYVDTFGECLRSLKLEHVSDVDFSWINVPACCGVKDGEIFPGTRITVRISKRDMFEPLEDRNKVVVTSWAYDGNSYPGNEYWAGSLGTSGDPQAACSTQVPELHNPLINPAFCGNNLRIASKKNGIIPIQHYFG